MMKKEIHSFTKKLQVFSWAFSFLWNFFNYCARTYAIETKPKHILVCIDSVTRKSNAFNFSRSLHFFLQALFCKYFYVFFLLLHASSLQCLKSFDSVYWLCVFAKNYQKWISAFSKGQVFFLPPKIFFARRKKIKCNNLYSRMKKTETL